MPGRERRATFWVGPLTFLVHLAGVSPGLVGSLVDDAMYVAMGTSLAQDGSGILIRPAATTQRKPASVLFGRVVHRGTPVSIDEAQGLAVAQRLVRRGAP